MELLRMEAFVVLDLVIEVINVLLTLGGSFILDPLLLLLLHLVLLLLLFHLFFDSLLELQLFCLQPQPSLPQKRNVWLTVTLFPHAGMRMSTDNTNFRLKQLIRI